MRMIAVLANVSLLVLTGILVATEGVSPEGWAIPLFIMMILAPLVSVVALLLKGSGSKDWLGCYFTRKAIEERRKLEALEKQTAP